MKPHDCTGSMRASAYEMKGPLSPMEGFLGSSSGKESTCNAGDLGSIAGMGRSPGGGHGNPFQYSCLETPQEEPGGLQSKWSQRIGHD